MNPKKIFSLFTLLFFAAILFAQSASVSSNGPICDGELGEYYIVGTANGVVTYTLDGVQDMVTLDNAGNATVITPTPPPVGIPGSICAMNSITVNGTTTGLGNQASILVNVLPADASVSADVTPICPESDGSFTVSGPPNSTIAYDITDSQSSTATVVLDTNGEATISVPSNGTLNMYFDIYSVTDPNTGCVKAYNAFANFATIAKKTLPAITLFEFTTANPICAGEAQVLRLEGTPGATFVINLNGAIYTNVLNASGVFQYTSTYGVGSWNNNLVSVSLDGCTVDLSNEPTLVLNVNALPEVTNVTGSAVCEGENMTWSIEGTIGAIVDVAISGAGTTTGSVTLDGTGMGEFAVVTASGNAGIYTLNISNISLNGCDNTSSLTADTEVKISPSITSYTTNAPICEGEDLVYSFTGTPNATFNITIPNLGNYTHTFDANGDHSFGFASPVSAGSYDLSLVDVSLDGCTVDLSNEPVQTSVVKPLPSIPTYEYTSPNPICEGITQSRKITGTPGAEVVFNANGGINTVTLNANGESLGSQGFVAGTYNINLVSTTLNGCVVDLSGEPTIVLTVVTPPEITSYTSNAPICEDESLVYSFTGTPNATFNITIPNIGNYTRTFDANGDHSLGFAAGAIVAGSYDLSLVDVSLDGCTVDLSNEPSQNSVVNPTPEVTNVTGSVVCEGESVTWSIEGTAGTVVDVSISGSGTTSGSVTLNGSGIGTFAVVTAAGNAGMYTLNITNVSIGNGCDNTSSLTATSEVKPLPEITSYTSNSPVCETEDVVFSFTGTPNADFRIEIQTNIYLSALDGTGNATIIFAAGALSAGSYDMNLVDASLNGCTSDLSNEATYTAVVEPSPINMTCSTAILMGCGDTEFGNTTCAVPSTVPDAFFGGTVTRRGLWYKYTGDGSTINATACNTQTNYDTKITIYDGSCGTLNIVASDDDGCGNLSSVAVLATTPGTEYYIFIYGHLNAVGGFGLSIGCANSPCPSSVSAISNGPLCENEIGMYTIQPSPATAASPGSIVYYTLEGIASSTVLDINGEATVLTPALAIGTPASILVLNEIRSASNLCPLTLSNGASIEVTDCSGCPLDLVLNNDPEMSGTQAAENSIQSTSIVQTSSSPVTYMAGNEIELNAGFEVKLGAEFNAIIDDCTILSLQEETTTPEAAVSKNNEHK